MKGALRFIEIAELFEKLESLSSTLEMQDTLAAFLKGVDRKRIDRVCYMLLGQLFCRFDNLDMEMAEKMILASLSLSSSADPDEISRLFRKEGDAGLVAQDLARRIRPILLVDEVHDALYQIALKSGPGSQDAKISILSALLEQASPLEARYIPRLALGTLRLGVGDMTLLNALAIAFTQGKENKEAIEAAYNSCPDIGIIAKALAGKGLAGVKRIGVRIGRPTLMMLAQRAKTTQEIMERMSEEFAAEEKYDGERVQAHCDGKHIILYSRRLEDITAQFPDVVEALGRSIRARRYIVEGEIVAVDKAGNLMPFQLLMQRRRKYKVAEYSRKIPICLYLFDCLYAGRTSLIGKPYPVRHDSLAENVKQDRVVKLVNRKVCRSMDCMEEFFNWCVSHGAEGIIAKTCAYDSVYTAGKRGYLWIKWKQEYHKLADTFDLAVVGAFAGKGKRAGLFGSLLCACYNKEEDRFETFCKLGSGFTDRQMSELQRIVERKKVSRKPPRLVIKEGMKPDIYVNNSIVVEVLGAEITESPLHTCGQKDGKGLALRFPRFRRIRTDRSPEQATTVQEIEVMFQKK